jgi:hypothetical protein
VEKFVRDYLDACESNDLSRELSFYASSMRYFDQGVVKLPFVERDVRNYYKHWPQRQFELLSLSVTPRRSAPDEYIARFRIRFLYHAGERHAEGQTDNTFGVRNENGNLKFTSLQERRRVAAAPKREASPCPSVPSF